MVDPRVGAWWWNELTGLDRSVSLLKRLRYSCATSHVADDTDRALPIPGIPPFPKTKSPPGRIFAFRHCKAENTLMDHGVSAKQ
jgi:hypothetical protein